MNKLKMTLIASSVVASVSAFSAPTFAADSSAISASGSATLVSDYRWRGFSQTMNKPAVQAEFDLSLPAGFYVGFWGSSIAADEFPGSAGIETDWYGGYTYTVNDDLSFDAGALYVYYPMASGNSGMNTTELHIAGTYKWLTLQYNVNASKYYGATGSKGSYYIQLDGHYPLTDSLTLDAHVGHQKVKGDAGFKYTDWSLGATYALPKDWSVSLAYVDSNLKKQDWEVNGKNIVGATAVLSLSKSF